MPTVTASARKKVPVTPLIVTSGRKTTMGVIVDPIRGTRISCSAFRMASPRDFIGIAVENNVFYHNDRVINHETDCRGQAAQRHQVKNSRPECEG